MGSTYIVLSSAGSKRDLAKGSREQAFWDDHAAHIDGLVESGFIMMGGPFDDGGAMLIARAESEAEVRSQIDSDPWYMNDILTLESIKHWDIFIDKR